MRPTSTSHLLLLTAALPALIAVLLGTFSSLTTPTYPVPAKGSAVVITGTSSGPAARACGDQTLLGRSSLGSRVPTKRVNNKPKITVLQPPTR